MLLGAQTHDDGGGVEGRHEAGGLGQQGGVRGRRVLVGVVGRRRPPHGIRMGWGKTIIDHLS